MIKWEANIHKVSNGYIIALASGDGSETTVISFSGEDERKDEIDSMVELCRVLAEHFAVFNSKHEKYNFVCEAVDANQQR